jgi:hypothetical protein
MRYLTLRGDNPSRCPFGDGGYRFGFMLKKISQAKPATKSGWVPEVLPDNIRKKVCGK